MQRSLALCLWLIAVPGVLVAQTPPATVVVPGAGAIDFSKVSSGTSGVQSPAQAGSAVTQGVPTTAAVGSSLPLSATGMNAGQNSEVYMDEYGKQQWCYGAGCAEKMSKLMQQRAAQRQEVQGKQMREMLAEEAQFKNPDADVSVALDKDVITSNAPQGRGNAKQLPQQAPIVKVQGKGVRLPQLPTSAVRKVPAAVSAQ